MANETLTRQLDIHNIEWLVQEGEVFALHISTLNNRVCAEWVNVTYVRLYKWLGY